MRTTTLLILFLFAALYTTAQSLDRDINNLDGSRILVTSEEEFYDDETVGMTYLISSNKRDTIRIINITLEDWGKMEKGRSFFLKFKDGSIMELKNEIDQIAHPVSGHFAMFGPAMCLQPQFVVTNEQLEQIISKEVIKLRFEQGDDLLDRKIKKNIISRIIKNCVEILEDSSSKQIDKLKGF